MGRIACCSAVLVTALAGQVSGQVLHQQDFNAGDGGYTVSNLGATEGPWTYDAGRGTWRCDGSANVASPTSSTLTSPTIAVTRAGQVTLEITHRYSFEYDGTRWDGGQVHVSVNGSTFTAVPSSSFAQNGYAVGPITGNNIFTGQEAFNGDSAGHGGGAFIVSLASLGTLQIGDSVRLQIVGAWDEFARGTTPNWEVNGIRVLGATLADSFDDWSLTGTQGALGWTNGYYNRTADGDATYQTGDFIAFTNDGTNVCSPTSNWDGTIFNLCPGDPPWTELGREGLHPAGDNPTHVPMRRWVSDYAGPAAIRWQTRKGNPGCGNGVTGRVLVNGLEIDAATIAFNDSVGVSRTVLRPIAVGDIIELALDPFGTDGTRLDACDGTMNRLTIEAGVPDDDGDGVGNPDDNCIDEPNPSQTDTDSDGVGDACDNCPSDANPGQEDREQDGIGNACDMALADSIDDWSPTGQQGFKLWFSGYYNFTTDPDSIYQPGDFIPFLNDGTGVVSATNHWGGDHFRLAPDAGATGGPWTFLGREDTHPNGTNSAPNQEHWTIRRWVNTTFTGDVAITWHTRKTNPGGTGTTGRLLLNGTQVDSATVSGGVTRTFFAHIVPGTRIDLALTPEGFGDRNDGADGSANWMRIKAKVPCDSFNIGERVADSQADWSTAGAQGANNWYYGYYDLRDDLVNGNGRYDTVDFTEFLNDGSGVVSADPTIGGWQSHPNHWNGGAWDLLNSGVVFTGPWTELTQSGGHPAANGQGDPSVHWFVRRWVSPADEDVQITGTLHTAAPCGDGTIGRIFINGIEQFAEHAQGGAISLTLTSIRLNAGDILDFAVDPDGAGNLGIGGIDTINDGCDSTTFAVTLNRIEVFNSCARQIAGDCTQDGTLGLPDLVCGIGNLFPTFVLVGDTPGLPCGGSPVDPGNLMVLDVDGNGQLTIADVSYLASYLFAGGPPPTLGTSCFDVTDCAANVICD